MYFYAGVCDIKKQTQTARFMGPMLAHEPASWSSGRVQDSGFGSRSSPEFDTLPVRLVVVPLSKALHAALLLSTQEQMGTCEGRFVSRDAKLRVSGCILPRELRWISKWIWTVKAQWPGKVLVKVCRAELWAWMWTQNSDFTFTFTWVLLVPDGPHVGPMNLAVRDGLLAISWVRELILDISIKISFIEIQLCKM